MLSTNNPWYSVEAMQSYHGPNEFFLPGGRPTETVALGWEILSGLAGSDGHY